MDVTKTIKDAAYITIGFGVLAFQKAQVRRREIEKQLEDQTIDLRAQFSKVADEVEERIEPLVEAVETSLDQLEERLPEQAREALLAIWSAMNDCIERGLRGTGLLPGVLKVRRRAARIHRLLVEAAASKARASTAWSSGDSFFQALSSSTR